MKTMNLTPSSAQLLAHPEVAKTICSTLLATGTRRQDVEDARQEVYVRALRFLRARPESAPTELASMKALCARIARNYAIDQYRKAKTRKEELDAECDRSEYGVVERESVPKRDPVDAGRQLEVLADLFREGEMPAHGVEILEGIACGCTFRQVAEAVGINEELAKWRMREMKRIYRSRMARLGMLPGMKPLRVLISDPSALSLLRQVA